MKINQPPKIQRFPSWQPPRNGSSPKLEHIKKMNDKIYFAKIIDMLPYLGSPTSLCWICNYCSLWDALNFAHLISPLSLLDIILSLFLA